MPFCESIKSRNFFSLFAFHWLDFSSSFLAFRLRLNFNFQKKNSIRRSREFFLFFESLKTKTFSFALARRIFLQIFSFNLTFSSVVAFTHTEQPFFTPRGWKIPENGDFPAFPQRLANQSFLILFGWFSEHRRNAPAIKWSWKWLNYTSNPPYFFASIAITFRPKLRFYPFRVPLEIREGRARALTRTFISTRDYISM